MHFSKKCDVIRYGRSRLFPHTYPIIVSVLLDVRNQTYKDTLPFETRSAKWKIYIISTPCSKNTKKRRNLTTLFCSGDEFWSTPHAGETHLKTNPNCFFVMNAPEKMPPSRVKVGNQAQNLNDVWWPFCLRIGHSFGFRLDGWWCAVIFSPQKCESNKACGTNVRVSLCVPVMTLVDSCIRRFSVFMTGPKPIDLFRRRKATRQLIQITSFEVMYSCGRIKRTCLGRNSLTPVDGFFWPSTGIVLKRHSPPSLLLFVQVSGLVGQSQALRNQPLVVLIAPHSMALYNTTWELKSTETVQNKARRTRRVPRVLLDETLDRLRFVQYRNNQHSCCSRDVQTLNRRVHRVLQKSDICWFRNTW